MQQRAGKIIVVVFLLAIFLSGCHLQIGFKGWAWGNKTTGSFSYLTGTKSKTIRLKTGSTIVFDYELEAESGELKAVLEKPGGGALIEFEPNTNGRKQAVIEENGAYQLVIRAEKARGSYRFEWVEEKSEPE